ncbi:MAG: hypothetical protein R2719_05150 [Micropruina sp.]
MSDLPFWALAETLLAFVRDHDDASLSPEAISEILGTVDGRGFGEPRSRHWWTR